MRQYGGLQLQIKPLCYNKVIETLGIKNKLTINLVEINRVTTLPLF